MLILPRSIPVKDKMDAGKAFKVSLMKEVIKPTIPHRHAGYHELILLSQGSGFHEVDGVDIEVNAPVAYYLRPGQTHCWNFSAIPKGYVILFREDVLLKQDMDAIFQFPVAIALPQNDTLLRIAAILYDEYSSDHLTLAAASAYLHLLINKLAYTITNEAPALNQVTNLFQQFKQLVYTHFALRKDLGFYAAQLHVTTAVLNQSCKKAVGKTPGAIINERVLLEAKLLLSATAKSINEVSDELGFSDSPHFTKFFKQHTNLTPRLYREMAQAK